jgi:hypothetical protein
MNHSPISLFTQFALSPWPCPDSFPFSGGSFEEKKKKKKPSVLLFLIGSTTMGIRTPSHGLMLLMFVASLFFFSLVIRL